ncbi:peptidylprolyl isomerase [Mariniblastus sp.]|nr:peptidylprolyl isomerase [Mariniblastus sp.]MDB4357495.1 peptidylprolyl isomerase [Mariniblastus sp.]MDB4380646.1 peptidylprolyl isomerase [Mariniblastus sp.]
MMLTLCRNALLSVMAITICSCLPLIAQDNSTPTPTANPDVAAAQELLLESPSKDDSMTFEEVLAQYNENKVTITRLFSSSPIGFPKRQIEHMAKIDRLKEQNRQLKNRLDEAALLSFQQSANPSPPVCQAVFNIISKKIDISRGGYDFDPEKALEVAKLMLTKMDQVNELSSTIRMEDVAYQGFLAANAIENYPDANAMLTRIEDQKIALQPTIRSEFNDSVTKWNREQKIRNQEKTSNDLPRVTLETSEGEIVVELFENEAPKTVGNFIHLVENKFYDQMNFFLVLPGRIAQTGCKNDRGTGDPGYKIPCETSGDKMRHHFSGTLSMANSGSDTGGSQFFISYQRNKNFDGKKTVFGRVISGMDAVQQLNRVTGTGSLTMNPSKQGNYSKILTATVTRKRDHEYLPTKITEKKPQ